MTQIQKRDGRLVNYDRQRITNAIRFAMQRTEKGVDEDLINKIADSIENVDKKTMEVEEIQNLIENKLMASSRKDVAREYIKYRNKRSEERMKHSDLMKKFQGIIDLTELQNENANMPEQVFTAKQNRMGSESAKIYAMNYLLSPRVKEAFLNNEIYIHDFNSYATGMHNCLVVDFEDVFKRGFKTHNCDVRPPQSIKSAMQLVAVVFQCVSNCQFGGVSTNKLDHDLVPYVKKSFIHHFKDGLKYIDNADLSLVDLNNIYMDNMDLKNKYPKSFIYALDKTIEEMQQASEALFHNLNTLQSRAGDQLPFTSVNFGTNTTTEGKLIIKTLLETQIKGVGRNHLTSIFPITIFQIMKGVNDKEGTPNYELKKLAIECASKRIYPNFVNVDAPHLPKPNNPNEFHCTMGCRTQVGVDRHGIEGHSGRGNISPITINLTKLGVRHGICLNERHTADLEGFWKELDDYLDKGVQALLERFDWQGKQLAKSAPFLYENNILKHHRKLNPDEPVREAIKHGTLAMGWIGLSNCMVAMFGKHQGEDEKVHEFALSVAKYIHEYAKVMANKHDLNFSSYATPAESLCMSMMKKLQQEYGKIEGVTDRPYLNNSYHIPVYYPISIKKKLELEAPFHKFATGGSISYVELDGNARNNLKAFEDIIDYGIDLGISYLAVNHPIDTCMDCGYEGIIGNECPACHKKDGDVYIKRLRRVTGYLTNSYKEFFNDGKKAEVEDRIKHSDYTDFEDLIK